MSRYHPRSGLPPQYPSTRRGSNTPSMGKPPIPNRSRSLDGLLDSEPTSAASNATTIEQTPSEKTKSCDDLDNNKQTDCENVDKVSIQSSDSIKRKRNFMDRCVNKVRSLIKK